MDFDFEPFRLCKLYSFNAIGEKEIVGIFLRMANVQVPDGFALNRKVTFAISDTGCRNRRCLHYDVCLDFMSLINWRKVSCNLCPHRNAPEINNVESWQQDEYKDNIIKRKIRIHKNIFTTTKFYIPKIYLNPGSPYLLKPGIVHRKIIKTKRKKIVIPKKPKAASVKKNTNPQVHGSQGIYCRIVVEGMDPMPLISKDIESAVKRAKKLAGNISAHLVLEQVVFGDHVNGQYETIILDEEA